MKSENQVMLEFPSRSCNEAFARGVVAVFAAQLDPTLDELNDIKTAVSEAVTNCIVHAYSAMNGNIYITAALYPDNMLTVRIRDTGIGIADINQAREPLFTTGGDDRSGLGFSVMECFSDKLKVTSKEGKGTTVTIYKKIRGKSVDES